MASPGHKTLPVMIASRENQVKALELRKGGASYSMIASALGVTLSTAFRYVMKSIRELEEEAREQASELRRMELERLDSIQFELWPHREDPQVASALLRLMDRRSKLLGLDAPTKSAITDVEGNDLGTDALNIINAKLLS